jgi:hypothetical protein
MNFTFAARPGPLESFHFRRIINLPQRNPDQLGAELVNPLTSILKTDNGSMTLWPLQALALYEAAAFDGIFCGLPVGQGKTIVTFLLPTVMDAKKALLLIPGALRDKTLYDFAELEKHWVKHTNYEIASYEYVSTHPNFLNEVGADLIIADEAHNLKNRAAGCTKRVLKYWRTAGNCRFVPLSGTVATRSFYDYWHLQLIALPPKGSILPEDYKEAELWCQALDVNPPTRAGLGALTYFGPDLDNARKGYGSFIRKVPGVILADSVDVGASITLDFIDVDSEPIRKAWQQLEDMWQLPNGDFVCTGPEFYRQAREIALGFYYVWKHPAPDYWAAARSEYGSFIRSELRYSRKYETASQIDEAYASAWAVKNWKSVEKDFIPETIPIWFDESIIERIAEWAIEKGGYIVWYKHRAIGEVLKKYMPTFGSKGRCLNSGLSVTVQEVDKTIAASINACAEGFNLQKWSKNLILSPPANGRTWEQLIGRTHRSGQLADTVDLKILSTLQLAYDDYGKAYRDAKYIQSTTAQKQKLLMADLIGEQ